MGPCTIRALGNIQDSQYHFFAFPSIQGKYRYVIFFFQFLLFFHENVFLFTKVIVKAALYLSWTHPCYHVPFLALPPCSPCRSGISCPAVMTDSSRLGQTFWLVCKGTQREVQGRCPERRQNTLQRRTYWREAGIHLHAEKWL